MVDASLAGSSSWGQDVEKRDTLTSTAPIERSLLHLFLASNFKRTTGGRHGGRQICHGDVTAAVKGLLHISAYQYPVEHSRATHRSSTAAGRSLRAARGAAPLATLVQREGVGRVLRVRLTRAKRD